MFSFGSKVTKRYPFIKSVRKITLLVQWQNSGVILQIDG